MNFDARQQAIWLLVGLRRTCFAEWMFCGRVESGEGWRRLQHAVQYLQAMKP